MWCLQRCKKVWFSRRNQILFEKPHILCAPLCKTLCILGISTSLGPQRTWGNLNWHKQIVFMSTWLNFDVMMQKLNFCFALSFFEMETVLCGVDLTQYSLLKLKWEKCDLLICMFVRSSDVFISSHLISAHGFDSVKKNTYSCLREIETGNWIRKTKNPTQMEPLLRFKCRY